MLDIGSNTEYIGSEAKLVKHTSLKRKTESSILSTLTKVIRGQIMKKNKKTSEGINIIGTKFGCVEYSEVHAEVMRDIARALNTNAEALLTLSKVMNGTTELNIEGPMLQITQCSED